MKVTGWAEKEKNTPYAKNELLLLAIMHDGVGVPEPNQTKPNRTLNAQSPDSSLA